MPPAASPASWLGAAGRRSHDHEAVASRARPGLAHGRQLESGRPKLSGGERPACRHGHSGGGQGLDRRLLIGGYGDESRAGSERMPAAAAHRGHASGEDPCRLRRHHERRIGLGGCGGKALNLGAGRYAFHGDGGRKDGCANLVDERRDGESGIPEGVVDDGQEHATAFACQ
jgi:hypothetical protein